MTWFYNQQMFIFFIWRYNLISCDLENILFQLQNEYKYETKKFGENLNKQTVKINHHESSLNLLFCQKFSLSPSLLAKLWFIYFSASPQMKILFLYRILLFSQQRRKHKSDWFYFERALVWGQILLFHWLRVITWPGYRPLIGWEWSHDLDTGLSLVRQITWPG